MFKFLKPLNKVRNKFQKRKDIRALLGSGITLFIIFLTGTFGFVYIESYTLVEAAFMTIITISTVGFREVHELSPEGMIFTGTLIIVSFGIFAYVLTTFTRFFIDGDFRKYLIFRKVSKHIKKIENHVIVCGFGRNGKQAAYELIAHGERVIIIDQDDTVNDEYVLNKDWVFIIGDATKDEILEIARVEHAKALITTLPSDADNLFVVLTAREKNSNIIIISRASDDNSDSKLKRAGANNVIMPDKVGGTRMAKLVSEPDIVEFIEAIMMRNEKIVNIVVISCKNEMHKNYYHKTIRQLNIRKVTGANLLGLKNETGEFVYNPSPDIKLIPQYKLFALGTPQQIDNLRKLLSEAPKFL